MRPHGGRTFQGSDTLTDKVHPNQERFGSHEAPMCDKYFPKNYVTRA